MIIARIRVHVNQNLFRAALLGRSQTQRLPVPRQAPSCWILFLSVAAVTVAARRAAEALSFVVGSFDVIETRRGFWFIDFNSQSNVSEDCDELYGMDLMAEHAACMARRLRGHGA